MIEHPQLAMLPCSECQQWVHDLKTGKPTLYGGQKVKQHPSGPPCVQEPGICPKGKPGESDLTDQNERVWQHFRQCRATGEFPDDGIVKRHAAILEPIVAGAERRRQSNELVVGLGKIFARTRK